MTGSAKQSMPQHKERMDCFVANAPRNDGRNQTQLRDLAARFRASFALEPPALQSEGAGNAGRPMRPIAACATIVVVGTRVSQVTPEIARHSPRSGFTAYFVLSRAIGLFCHPHRLHQAAGLTPASRRQDHTTSPSAKQAPSSLAPLASTASCPASVTISSRPSSGTGRGDIKVIWVFGKSEYFCKGGWTGFCRFARRVHWQEDLDQGEEPLDGVARGRTRTCQNGRKSALVRQRLNML